MNTKPEEINIEQEVKDFEKTDKLFGGRLDIPNVADVIDDSTFAELNIIQINTLTESVSTTIVIAKENNFNSN